MAKTLHSHWRGLGLIPGQGTRSPILQLRVCMLQLRHRQGKKKGNVYSNRKKKKLQIVKEEISNIFILCLNIVPGAVLSALHIF